MSNAAFEVGVATFRESLEQAEKENEGKPWKAGGRATAKFPNKEDRAWWMSQGPTMVNNYLAWRKHNTNLEIWHTDEGVPAIEIAVYVKMPGDLILNSKIDRVFINKNNGQLLIVDLKTGQPPKSGLQLAVYRLALQEQFGIDIAHGSYWMAREGNLSTVYDLRQYSNDMVARWLRDVKKSIDMGIFVPNTGFLCNTCGFLRNCYAHGATTYLPDFASDLTKENK